MTVLRSTASIRQITLKWRRAGRRIGLVPTMGALHQGHLALIRRACRENDKVVVSIFVNPTQFGPTEDLSRYPRPFRRDVALCRDAGAAAVFAPRSNQFYPSGFQTWVNVEQVSRPLCGPFRPGHFRGVATVVLKLFNVVQPDRAYFGEKDFQQLRVIQRLVKDLDVPVRVIPVPTVREKSGLALSSRNAYLSTEERRSAQEVSRALRAAAQVLKSGGTPATARRAARTVLGRLSGLRIQYVDVVDPTTLLSNPSPTGPWRVAAAVFVGKTRLIDNRGVTR